MKERTVSAVWRVFLLVYAFLLAVILVLCVMETQDNIAVGPMVFYPLIGLVIVSALALAGSRIEGFLEKYEKYLLVLFFVLYAIVLFRFTLHSRGIPQNDQECLIDGAKYMAGVSDYIAWTYFARWNHNIMPMIFLSIVFRIAKVLHMEDGYYLALALNCAQVLLTLYCVFRLGKRYAKHSHAAAWLGMGMMAVFIPIMGHTQALYTDSFSFGFGIIAFSVWLGNYEKRKGGVNFWLINIAAGIIWAIGFEIKATVVISLIAVFLYLLLYEGWKTVLKNMAGLFLPVLLIAAVCSVYIGTLPSKEYADTWGVPQIGYFVGVGLEGNGGFDADSEYFRGVTGTYGMKEKKEFSNAFIREHLDRFLDPEHMTAKLRHNFATGVMRADDFMVEAEHNGFLYNCIAYKGAYREPYRIGITAYWYMLLEWILIACVLRALIKGKRREREEAAVFVPIVSVCGIMIYVMLFEANNRQLYNHLSMIFCAANMGIWSLQNFIRTRRFFDFRKA